MYNSEHAHRDVCTKVVSAGWDEVYWGGYYGVMKLCRSFDSCSKLELDFRGSHSKEYQFDIIVKKAMGFMLQ